MKTRSVLALFAFLAAVPLSAQVTTATVYGRIVDPSGAGVPQAKVSLLNEGTNSRSNVVSDTIGEFTIGFLPVGRYTVSIEAAGFKAQKQSGMELSAGQRIGIEYKLALGNVAEVVEVSGSAPLINTVSAEQREGKIEAEVRELPVSRRD